MHYTVVFERTGTGYSAYVPDLPGCVTTGKSLPITRRNMREAILGHVAVMRELGQRVPRPRTRAEEIEVAA